MLLYRRLDWGIGKLIYMHEPWYSEHCDEHCCVLNTEHCNEMPWNYCEIKQTLLTSTWHMEPLECV